MAIEDQLNIEPTLDPDKYEDLDPIPSSSRDQERQKQQVAKDQKQTKTPDKAVTESMSDVVDQVMEERGKTSNFQISPENTVDINKDGYIDVDSTVQAMKATRQVLFDSQFRDLRSSDTADSVFDGGIKEGGNLVIRIVPESQSLGQAAKPLVRRELAQTNGRPVNLMFEKFSVQSLSEPDQERQQIKQTFGADFMYAFGRQPRRLSITGQVLNGKMKVEVDGNIYSMDWANAFQRNYDRYYRATQLIKNRQKILIYANDTIYSGYITRMQAFTSADTQSIKQVTLQMIVGRKTYPRDKDDRIPGRLDEESNTVVINKDVSEQALQSLEGSFNESLEQTVRQAISDQRRRIDAIAKRLVLMGADADSVKSAARTSQEGEYTTLTSNLRAHNLFYKDEVTFLDNELLEVGIETGTGQYSGIEKRYEKLNNLAELLTKETKTLISYEDKLSRIT